MGPEKRIQNAIIQALELRGWHCNVTHGNMYQSGFPDVYAIHPKKGQRWIEVKVKGAFAFTPAQKLWYPRMHACGIGIWVLMSVDEIHLLDHPPNLERVMLGKLL